MYMENVKEHYWRYSLITIILGLGVILFFKITPFLGGILGAFTIYILLRGQMFHLTEKLNMRPAFAALLLLGETILCFLIPITLAIWLVINKTQNINLFTRNPAALPANARDTFGTVFISTSPMFTIETAPVNVFLLCVP